MEYQSALPFDDNYAWLNFIKHLRRLPIGGHISYYGLNNRKVGITKLPNKRYLLTSYSFETLKKRITYEGDKKFIEVEFMSTVLQSQNKHIHVYEKSRKKASEWKKQVYRCANPTCSHYTLAPNIEGKQAKCKCGALFIIQIKDLWHKKVNLTCLNCSNTKEAKIAVESKELFLNIMEEIEEKPEENLPYSQTIQSINNENGKV